MGCKIRHKHNVTNYPSTSTSAIYYQVSTPPWLLFDSYYLMLSNIKKCTLMRFMAFMVHIRKYPLLNASNGKEKWWRHKKLNLWNYGIGWLCTDGLTFGKGAFFIMFFLTMPTIPIISEIWIFVTSHFSCLFCFNMSSYGNYKSLCVIQSTLYISGHRCPVHTKFQGATSILTCNSKYTKRRNILQTWFWG